MGIFKKRETIIDANSVEDVLLKALLKGESITREQAMSIPSVSASVDFICNTFAMIPFRLYEQSTDEEGKKYTKEVDDDRVRLINSDTKDTLDGFQFKKALCEDYLMGKGGYAYIKKNRNKFVGLFYVSENYIAIQKNTHPIYKGYDILVQNERFNSYEFLKLLRNTKDGASGIGIAEEIDKSLQTAYKRLLYDYDLTVTGGSRKGFIKSQKHLDEKAIKALKQAWKDYYSGNANTVILNDGMEFQEASNSSKENEINEKEQTFAKQVLNLFHIGNSYEETVKNAIMPIATAFANALNRDLLLEKEKKKYYFAPDTKELYKGSLRERYEAYKIAIDCGFKTRNEIRYLEDDDAIEGLDVINLGLGSVLLDAKSGQIYTPNTDKTVKIGETAPNDVEPVQYEPNIEETE